MSDSTNKA